MSDIQDWCKEIIPVINASASGGIIQYRPIGGDCWSELRTMCIRGDMGLEYRIKPRTIKIGDFDVPEPMRNEPDPWCEYFVVETLGYITVSRQTWNGLDCEKRWLSRGLCHKSKEPAIAHAEAIISLTSAK